MKDLCSNSTQVTRILVSVFAAPGLPGTRASIWLMAHKPDISDIARATSTDQSEACCFCWPDGDGIQVACYNSGVAIEFCGHGLLACAAAWRKQYSLPTRLITESATGKTQTYEVSGDSNGTLWLQAARIACTEAAPPKEPWFNCDSDVAFSAAAAPQSAAVAGPDNGYWILRWPDGYDLTALRPNFSAICRSTSRALVATCRARPGSHHDVGLRYFAPQYGNNEDSVTGSAAVVLAEYWQQPELVLRQYSPAGGVIRARLGQDTVAIGGATAIIPDPEPEPVLATGLSGKVWNNQRK